MADLSDLQAAQTVKIAGANPSTGIEDNYLEVDSSGRSTVNTAQNTASGTITASGTLIIDTSGMSAVALAITGTPVGQVYFEVSLDAGTTWYSISGYDLATNSGTQLYASVFPSLFRNNVSGFNKFRLRADPTMTGSAICKLSTTNGSTTTLDSTNDYLYTRSNTRDGAGVDITSTTDGAKQALDIHVANTAAISVSAAQSGTWNITNVSGTISLPTGASTSANQTTELTRIGDVTETAPATDIASSGLNGRLQRVAQRITSLIALIPASLGQKAMSASLAVTVASDQSAIPASQSGTWNITNVSGTVSLPTGASTETTLAKLTQTQGSSTSGQSGPLTQAAVTTAVPAYSNAQTSPLSQTTAGGLRTDNSSIAGTITATGNGVVSAGVQRVAISSDNTAFSVNAFGINPASTAKNLRLPGIDSGNSTTATLTANSIFTGAWTDVSEYSNLSIMIFVDQISATNGLNFEYSSDATNVDDGDAYTIPASNGQQISVPLTTRYYRIRYVNGTTNQGAFRMQAKLHTDRPKPSSMRSNDTVSTESDAELVKSIEMAKADDGIFYDLTSSVITGTANTKRSLDVTQVPTAVNYFSTPVQIRQTAATAANATVFSMRNAAAATKTVFVERIYLQTSFDAGTPIGRSLQRYTIGRFSTATPTAGTAQTPAAMDSSNSATQVTDVRFVDTGLTTTSVVFDNPIAIIGCPATDATTSTFIREGIPIKLAPGEGLCIRLTVTAVIGQDLLGEIVWSER